MDVAILEDIGLTNAQALAYRSLVEQNGATAPVIATLIGESRTNAYKVLDKLCELGLATKDQSDKVYYFPTSPTALEQLIQKQADEIHFRGRKLKAAMPVMLDYFFAHSERPSIRYFQGRQGLEQIYKDQIATGKPVVYIRTLDDLRLMSFENLHHIRNLYPRFGITRSAITQDVVSPIPDNMPRVPIAESDKAMLLTRTWINKEDYDEPVEWAAYGNKLAIVSYGEEAMGMIIESEQIANAFRRIFFLLDEGIRRRPDYNEMPRHVTHTAQPTSFKDDALLGPKRNQSSL